MTKKSFILILGLSFLMSGAVMAAGQGKGKNATPAPELTTQEIADSKTAVVSFVFKRLDSSAGYVIHGEGNGIIHFITADRFFIFPLPTRFV